jgi:mono/diheme cytochrome c family protein
MSGKVAILTLTLAAGTLLSSRSEASQTSALPRTVLEGVYTAGQAMRGAAAYQTHCASCHRDDLTGLHASALNGNFFMDRWREFRLEVLFNTISTTMPRGAPRSLSDEAYLDILAFVLQANDVPPGSTELSAEVARQTLLVGKDGPKPLPTSTPVDVTGCLSQNGGTWFLMRAGEPVRTINQWEMTEEETGEAKLRPLGDLRFRLQDLTDVPGFVAAALANNRIEVKGLLVRQPGNERINVTAVQQLASGCE